MICLLALGLFAAWPARLASAYHQEDLGSASVTARTDPVVLEALIAALDGELEDEVAAAKLSEGFRAFLSLMEEKNGPGAVGIATAMHRRAGAVWSAFCLEGALRRSAPADPLGSSSLEAYSVADGALTALLRDDSLPAADRLAVVQRRAILAAGFADVPSARASLGRALAAGGIDGAQILGLEGLIEGRPEEAARLFGLLLDRGDPSAECPWALRGHALSSLALLRGRP